MESRTWQVLSTPPKPPLPDLPLDIKFPTGTKIDLALYDRKQREQRAMTNTEKFLDKAPGTVTLQDVKASSAGVTRWYQLRPIKQRKQRAMTNKDKYLKNGTAVGLARYEQMCREQRAVHNREKLLRKAPALLRFKK